MPLMNEAFKTWNRLIKLNLTTAEMMISSSQTISSRTTLFSENMHSPEKVEDEYHRMSNEKFEAASQSSAAILEGYFDFSNKLLEASTKCLTQSCQELLFTPLSMQTVGGPQMAYWNAIQQSSMESLNMTNSTLSTMENSLHPIHSRTSSNAKRLTR